MAPEIFQRLAYDGRQADIWSVAVTLLLCLTGRYAWEAPTSFYHPRDTPYVGLFSCFFASIFSSIFLLVVDFCFLVILLPLVSIHGASVPPRPSPLLPPPLSAPCNQRLPGPTCASNYMRFTNSPALCPPIPPQAAGRYNPQSFRRNSVPSSPFCHVAF